MTRDDQDLTIQINTAYFEQICLVLRDALLNQLAANNSWFSLYANYKIRGCLADIEMFLARPDGTDFSCYKEQDIALVHKTFNRVAKYLPSFLSADDAANINTFVNTLADAGMLPSSAAVQSNISHLSTHVECLYSHSVLKRRLINFHNALTANNQTAKSQSVTASTQLISQALASEEEAPTAQQPTVDAWQATTQKIANIMAAAEFNKAPPLPLSLFGKLKKLWFTYHPEGYQPERQPDDVYNSLKSAVSEAKGPAVLAQAVAAFKASWYAQGKPSKAITEKLDQLDDCVALAKHDAIYDDCRQLQEQRSVVDSPRSSETRRPSLRSNASNEPLDASHPQQEVGYVSFADHDDFKQLSKKPEGRLSGYNNQGLWKYLPGSQPANQQSVHRSLSRRQ